MEKVFIAVILVCFEDVGCLRTYTDPAPNEDVCRVLMESLLIDMELAAEGRKRLPIYVRGKCVEFDIRGGRYD